MPRASAQTSLLPYMANIHLFISKHLKLSFGLFLPLLLFLKFLSVYSLATQDRAATRSPHIHNPGLGLLSVCVCFGMRTKCFTLVNI